MSVWEAPKLGRATFWSFFLTRHGALPKSVNDLPLWNYDG